MKSHLAALIALSSWFLVGAACSSFDSNNPKDGGSGGAGAGAGGTGGTGAGTGSGGTSGSGGAGGAQIDAGSHDAPMSMDAAADAPMDAASHCPDGGDAGACGCGVSDVDTDHDGTPDCYDGCPTDPTKTTPGSCGCFIAETDTDHDGTPDCIDQCPTNPARQTSGLCGCALPDTAAPLCLAHRYSFDDGTSTAATTTVVDSVGNANGTASNVTLNGTGTLTLAQQPVGQPAQYVTLPSGIISGLGNSATFEAWFTWTGTGGVWQRVFDFGTNDSATPGGQGNGTAFVFFTPSSGLAGNGALLSVNTVGLTEVMGASFFPPGLTAQQKPHHLACVINSAHGDGGSGSAAVYVDGTLIGSTPLVSTLSGLNDANNWLGRSQFAPDPAFSGTYYELRIHSSALTQAQINASIAAGPDALPGTGGADGGTGGNGTGGTTDAGAGGAGGGQVPDSGAGGHVVGDGGTGSTLVPWHAFLPLAAAAPGSVPADGTTLDLSPNHYDATYFGTTLSFANGSLNMTGVGSEVVVVPARSGVPAVDVTGSYSVSAWVTMTNTGGFRTFVAGEGVNVASFFLQKRGDTNAFAFTTTAVDSTTASGGCIAPGPATDGGAAQNLVIPVVGTQYHLVATRDATTGIQILYVNGVESGRNTCLAGFVDTGILGIGHGIFGANRVDNVQGAIADVAVIDRVLTPAEIAALYALGR